MAQDNLAAKLQTLARNQRRDFYLQDVQFRNPGALTGEGSEPWLDASVFADATDVHIANAVTIANGVTRADATGQALDDWAVRLGTARRPPQGGGGAASAPVGTGGAKIFAGDVCKHLPTGLRFICAVTKTYAATDQVPIAGLDAGPSTNLDPGTVLTWQAPRPGMIATSKVLTQANGSGLSGGSNAETDDQLRDRLDYIAANPPASGNEAEYQSAISQTPLLSVLQAFTFPACVGPGSKGAGFLLRPSQPGANRIPSAAQLAQMAASLQGQMPGDDGVYQIAFIASPTTVVLKVLWAQGASGWADIQPWPPYYATPNLVACAAPSSGTTSPLYFRLTSTSLTVAPAVGQSIAFFDLPNVTFRRKKILTATVDGAGGYDITVDTTGGFSDTGYQPAIGQACCPWSDSLNSLVLPVVSYFDTLGPGEMFASFSDPGLRQRRSPVSPQFWPNQITNRLLGGAAAPLPASGAAQNLPPRPTLLTSPSLQDVSLTEPAIPYATPVGSPGVSAYLLTLGGLIVFGEP